MILTFIPSFHVKFQDPLFHRQRPLTILPIILDYLGMRYVATVFYIAGSLFFEQLVLLLALLGTSEANMWLCQLSIPSKFSDLGYFRSLILLKSAYVF